MPSEFEFPPKTFSETKRQVAAILWTLYLDGPFEHKSGGASGLLRDALIRRRVRISPGNLNLILNKMDHPGAPYGNLIRRTINGKRTMAISLRVDPDRNPFPKNPFPHDSTAKFQRTNQPEAVEVDDGEEEPEMEETFSRQALLSDNNGAVDDETEGDVDDDIMARLRRASDAAPAAEETIIEDLAEDLEHVVEQLAGHRVDETIGAIERMPTTPVSTPTVTGVLDDLAIGVHPQTMAGSSAELLTSAIGLISQAMTQRIAEDAARQQQDGFNVAQLVDERMAAYVALVDRNAKLEEGLRRSLTREQELVGLVRTLQATIEQLQGASNGAGAR